MELSLPLFLPGMGKLTTPRVITADPVNISSDTTATRTHDLCLLDSVLLPFTWELVIDAELTAQREVAA